MAKATRAVTVSNLNDPKRENGYYYCPFPPSRVFDVFGRRLSPKLVYNLVSAIACPRGEASSQSRTRCLDTAVQTELH